MKKNLKLSATICGLLMALSFAPGAFAWDFKVFNGSNCQASNQNVAGVYYWDWGILNISGTTQRVACPVDRDRVYVTNGVWLRVAGNAVYNCTFEKITVGGVPTWIVVSTGANAYGAWQFLTSTTAHDPYVLTCSMPNATLLRAYETAEYDQTDFE